MTSPSAVFSEIARGRRSIRAFRPDPIPEDVLKSIFTDALRAPSNCNTQPWFVHVATGDTIEALRKELPERFVAGDLSLDHPYDGKYEGVYRDRQHASARVLYDALGIPREQKAERQSWFLNNFRFFGAPAVAFLPCPGSLACGRPATLACLPKPSCLGVRQGAWGHARKQLWDFWRM